MTRTGIIYCVFALGLAACAQEPALAPPDQPQLQVGASANSPLEISYVKTETGSGTAQWTGSVSGDVSGDLRTQVVGLRVSGAIWHIDTLWEIDAGAASFNAELRGTLNTNTGKLLLTGQAVSGDLTGARIYDEGQLTGVDPVTGGTVFEGSILLIPRSAN